MSDNTRGFTVFDQLDGSSAAENVRHLVARLNLLGNLSADEERMTIFLDRVRDPDDAEDVLRIGLDYVQHDLKLNCPWLAWELTRWVSDRERLAKLGEDELVTDWWSRWDDGPEPPVKTKLTSLPDGWAVGLTESEIGARLESFLDQVQAALVDDAADMKVTPATKPLGVLRKDMAEIVQDRTRWFYQARVLRWPIRRIAKEAGRDRKQIRDGIEDAESLLSEVPALQFRDAPKIGRSI